MHTACVALPPVLRRFLPAWMLAMLACLGPAQLLAQGVATVATPLEKRVLILASSGVGNRGIDQYVTEVLEGLHAGGVRRANIYVEYLAMEQNRDAQVRRQLADFLRKKYAALPVDLVVTVQQPALSFLVGEGKGVAPGVTAIATDATVPPDADAGGRALVLQTRAFDYRGTAQRALELFPRTQRLVILIGSSEQEQSRLQHIYGALADLKGQVEMEDTH
ncbi:MAG TPA: hypothetical protein VLJ57_22345, partial [Burkholderiaceae bacterium]|nr:hypothetical protein [Burkholderiaceae bacterium]